MTTASAYDSTVPNYFTFVFAIGVDVNISKRVVKDFILILGEVGGLSSLIAIAISLFVSPFEEFVFQSHILNDLLKQE